MGAITKSQGDVNSLCAACGGQCCKVGFIVQVLPTDKLYNNKEYVHNTVAVHGESFQHMKSNGDGYTCKALKNGVCQVWKKRPQACRDFEVDGDRCKALRRYYGRP